MVEEWVFLEVPAKSALATGLLECWAEQGLAATVVQHLAATGNNILEMESATPQK